MLVKNLGNTMAAEFFQGVLETLLKDHEDVASPSASHIKRQITFDHFGVRMRNQAWSRLGNLIMACVAHSLEVFLISNDLVLAGRLWVFSNESIPMINPKASVFIILHLHVVARVRKRDRIPIRLVGDACLPAHLSVMAFHLLEGDKIAVSGLS